MYFNVYHVLTVPPSGPASQFGPGSADASGRCSAAEQPEGCWRKRCTAYSTCWGHRGQPLDRPNQKYRSAPDWSGFVQQSLMGGQLEMWILGLALKVESFERRLWEVFAHNGEEPNSTNPSLNLTHLQEVEDWFFSCSWHELCPHNVTWPQWGSWTPCCTARRTSQQTDLSVTKQEQNMKN